uniref:Type IV secretion system protein n=1 Tax=Gongylonema pulchrum TaxID=637853 RepID=A0A183DKD0_9BILA
LADDVSVLCINIKNNGLRIKYKFSAVPKHENNFFQDNKLYEMLSRLLMRTALPIEFSNIKFNYFDVTE